MLIPERICTLSLVSTAAGVFRTTVSEINFHPTTLGEAGCFNYKTSKIDRMAKASTLKDRPVRGEIHSLSLCVV
jgi:hypothetical protein